MAWAGTGALCVLARRSAAVLRSGQSRHIAKAASGELSFVQISDSHMGFNKPANPDVVGTLQAAIDKINALPMPPEVHPAHRRHQPSLEARGVRYRRSDSESRSAKDVFFVPGEHDVLKTTASNTCERYGKDTKGAGWYSFDKNGVHFVGLVNVMNLKAGGLGSLGREQLEWLEKDVKHLSNSTPIVVFAHMPLWTRLSGMGLGHRRQRAGAFLPEAFRLGDRAERTHSPDHAEGRRQRHLPHRDLDRVPATAPGAAPSPGPMKVPAEQLRSLLGSDRRDLRAQTSRPGIDRFHARIVGHFTPRRK